jgi:branched-chain amino acid transport system permease protein/urea transport system permease protein
VEITALVLNALTLISILMLVGLGLAIIFGLMNVINLAHGEFVTVGAYTLAAVQAAGGSYWLALALAPLVGAVTGALVERAIVQHLYTRPLATILATWGLSLALQQVIQLVFGAAPRRVTGPVEGSVAVLGASYPPTGCCSSPSPCCCDRLLRCLPVDAVRARHLRTVIQDRDMAEALGIDTAGSTSWPSPPGRRSPPSLGC